MISCSVHIVRIVYVFRVFVVVTQCNNLIVENKILITTLDSSMFKNFCRCNAVVSGIYNSKSKNKIVVVFFS